MMEHFQRNISIWKAQMQIQKWGFGIRGIRCIKMKLWKVYLTYNVVNIFNVCLKYLDVVLKASIISGCVSSESDIIKSLS